VDYRDNERIAELSNLRLALATFALHLDAFEMQLSEATSELNPVGAAQPRDIAARLQKENRSVRR
jgi:hypothetical protein